jgi:hypothetical protein
MPEPSLQFPVTCPDCAVESVSKMSIAVIAIGLLTGKNLRLHSNCHDRYWNATFIERENLRRSLALLNISAYTNENQPNSEELALAG